MNSRTEWYNMFIKITAIVLIMFIATPEGNEVWDGFTAKWATNPSDGYYHLPQSLKDAERQGWTEVLGIKAITHHVKGLGYFGDPRVVLLFSRLSGKLVGHQIGILVADIENEGVPINYTDNPAITRKTLNGEKYFTATAFYRDDVVRKIRITIPMNFQREFNETVKNLLRTEVMTGFGRKTNSRKIWLEVEGKLVEIPTDIKSVIQNTSYQSKDCVKSMGQHYFMSLTNCHIFPWFLLGVGNDIIGIRFQAIGNSSAAPNRTWFETIPHIHLGNTVPDEPECGTKGMTKYGVISFHVWFKKDPLAITCKDEFTAVYNSTLVREQSSDDSE